MPLSYTGIAAGSQAAAAQLKQVLDLLTGVMTDQAVTINNSLIHKGKYKCRAYASGSTTMAANTWVKILLNSVGPAPLTADPNGNFSTTNNRYTAPVTGTYMVVLHQAAQNAGISCAIYRNGVQTQVYAPGAGSSIPNEMTDFIDLVAGDYIEFWMMNTNGGTDTGGAGKTYMLVTLVSAN